MRRSLLVVASAVVLSSVSFLGSAGASSGMSVGLCVSQTQFEFDITVDDVEGSSLIVEMLNSNGGFIEWLTATISVNQATGDVAFTNGPAIMVVGAATDSWSLPFTDVVLSSAAGSVGWDVTWSGAVGHGAQPYSPGDSLPNAFSRDMTDPVSDIRIFDIAIADCGGPTTTTAAPTTTTAAPTTTTAAPTTTTAAAPTTTTADTSTSTSAAPTSTLPETGISDAVRVTAPLGLAVLLAGLLTLGGAAVVGRLRRSN